MKGKPIPGTRRLKVGELIKDGDRVWYYTRREYQSAERPASQDFGGRPSAVIGARVQREHIVRRPIPAKSARTVRRKRPPNTLHGKMPLIEKLMPRYSQYSQDYRAGLQDMWLAIKRHFAI